MLVGVWRALDASFWQTLVLGAFLVLALLLVALAAFTQSLAVMMVQDKARSVEGQNISHEYDGTHQST